MRQCYFGIYCPTMSALSMLSLIAYIFYIEVCVYQTILISPSICSIWLVNMCSKRSICTHHYKRLYKSQLKIPAAVAQFSKSQASLHTFELGSIGNNSGCYLDMFKWTSILYANTVSSTLKEDVCISLAAFGTPFWDNSVPQLSVHPVHTCAQSVYTCTRTHLAGLRKLACRL